MGYMILMMFRSLENAQQFVNNPQFVPVSPELATVPSGYIATPRTGIGLPNPGAQTIQNPSWVLVFPGNTSVFPAGYDPTFQVIWDTSIKGLLEYNTTNIDIQNLTVLDGPTGTDVIVKNGFPPAWDTSIIGTPGPTQSSPIGFSPEPDQWPPPFGFPGRGMGNIPPFTGPQPGGPIPPEITQQAPLYIPHGLHFDGQTVLTTSLLATTNTSKISFAGWFNIAPTPGNLVEFSQGDGAGDQLFVDTLPLPGWCHMMGSINAATGQAFLLINATPVGTVGTNGNVPFGNVPTNGKNLTIGGDSLGNFFTGDIADLTIWPDMTWIVNGEIPRDIVASFVFLEPIIGNANDLAGKAGKLLGFAMLPRLPSFSLAVFGNPAVFLSGPVDGVNGNAGAAGALPMLPMTGALKNSATDPPPFITISFQL